MTAETSEHAGPIAAVDHAVARLATDVGRLDAIDLDAPWVEARRCRRDVLASLIRTLDPDAESPDASHGTPLAAALLRAWAARRERLLEGSASSVPQSTVELLAEIHDAHVALDVGVHHHDLREAPDPSP